MADQLLPGAARPAASLAKTSRGVVIYAALLLAGVQMLSVADRNILSILLVPIQQDLKVSDAAMGALTGLSFTLVYATIALPMARLADRGNRRNIIAAALAIWSAMTAACGLAGSYIALLIARMGVAAGEASAQPAAMSLVGDTFAPARRGTALAIMMLGSGIGTAMGAIIAGQIAEAYGWQAAFFVLGAPGLLLALLMFLTLREPERGAQEGGDRPEMAASSWPQLLRYLFGIRSFRALIVGHICVGMAFALYVSWMPAFLMRVGGMSVKEASTWFGLQTFPALAGIIIGGLASDLAARRAARYRVLALAAMLLIGALVFTGLLITPLIGVSIALMCVYAFFVGPVAGLSPAANLDVVHPRARGAVTAVTGFGASVIGGGLGPMVLGAINDAVAPAYGDQALRYSLALEPITLVVGTVAFLVASRSTDRDAAALTARPAAQ